MESLLPLAKTTGEYPLPADEKLIRVENLVREFHVSTGYFFARKVGTIRAVDNLSFSIDQGETFGLVGESGCGKTTAGRILAGLLPATGGSVIFGDHDIVKEPLKSNSPLRRKIRMVFQDPLSSLNPRMKIFDTVSEPLEIQERLTRSEIRSRVSDALNEVNLSDSFFERYPHQLSGGQRQRVLIARALITEPQLVIADEPVSALDVSVQAQILNLIKDLRTRRNFSCLFISHDLAVVRYVCHRTGIMYMGTLVESGPSGEIFSEPLHPYTLALKESSPDIKHRSVGKLLDGSVPNPMEPPAGCPFHPRCPRVMNVCREQKPVTTEITAGRTVSCHLHKK